MSKWNVFLKFYWFLTGFICNVKLHANTLCCNMICMSLMWEITIYCARILLLLEADMIAAWFGGNGLLSAQKAVYM